VVVQHRHETRESGQDHRDVQLFVVSKRDSFEKDERRQKWQKYVKFEVFTAVTMKNVVFWDIKPEFILHRRHITSPLQSPAS
jgi:hypothetical protein